MKKLGATMWHPSYGAKWPGSQWGDCQRRDCHRASNLKLRPASVRLRLGTKLSVFESQGCSSRSDVAKLPIILYYEIEMGRISSDWLTYLATGLYRSVELASRCGRELEPIASRYYEDCAEAL